MLAAELMKKESKAMSIKNLYIIKKIKTVSHREIAFRGITRLKIYNVFGHWLPRVT